MNIDIRIDGESAEQELRSLHRWLQEEPEVRHHADIHLRASQSDPEEMGDALDLITLIVTSGMSFPGFAATIAGWRRTRRTQLPVIIEHGETKITLSEADPDLIEKIIKAFE